MADQQADSSSIIEEIQKALRGTFETDPGRIERERVRAEHLGTAIEKITLVCESLRPCFQALNEMEPDSPGALFIKANYVNALEAFLALTRLAQNAELLNTQLVAIAAHELGKHKAGGGQPT